MLPYSIRAQSDAPAVEHSHIGDKLDDVHGAVVVHFTACKWRFVVDLRRAMADVEG